MEAEEGGDSNVPSSSPYYCCSNRKRESRGVFNINEGGKPEEAVSRLGRMESGAVGRGFPGFLTAALVSCNSVYSERLILFIGVTTRTLIIACWDNPTSF